MSVDVIAQLLFNSISGLILTAAVATISMSFYWFRLDIAVRLVTYFIGALLAPLLLLVATLWNLRTGRQRYALLNMVSLGLYVLIIWPVFYWKGWEIEVLWTQIGPTKLLDLYFLYPTLLVEEFVTLIELFGAYAAGVGLFELTMKGRVRPTGFEPAR
jgi:hypothetical protein